MTSVTTPPARLRHLSVEERYEKSPPSSSRMCWSETRRKRSARLSAAVFRSGQRRRARSRKEGGGRVATGDRGTMSNALRPTRLFDERDRGTREPHQGDATTRRGSATWLGRADYFHRYLFRKQALRLGVPVPCNEAQWHAARCFDDATNSHSYVMLQWIEYLEAKGGRSLRSFTHDITTNENDGDRDSCGALSEGSCTVIPTLLAASLAVGFDASHLLSSASRTVLEDAERMNDVLEILASKATNLTTRLERRDRIMKKQRSDARDRSDSGRRRRRNAVSAAPVGYVASKSAPARATEGLLRELRDAMSIYKEIGEDIAEARKKQRDVIDRTINIVKALELNVPDVPWDFDMKNI